MIAHTYPINKAESNLRKLVKQARSTHRPVLLTSEETAAPVAVVLEIDAFEQTQRYQQLFFRLQLVYLKNWLTKLEQYWLDETVSEDDIATWKDNVKLLWEIAPRHLRKFAASFTLSVEKLTPERLTLDQIAALRHSLALFDYPELDTTTKRDAYQQLTRCGLPPKFVFDDEIIQSYLDEV